MNNNLNENACQEAYVIVNYLMESGDIVVPQNIMKIIEDGRNINYNFNINDINNVSLHPDTEKILTAVYLNCMATSSDKARINKALGTINKTIIGTESKQPSKSLATLSWSDKIRQKLFSPIKI